MRKSHTIFFLKFHSILCLSFFMLLDQHSFSQENTLPSVSDKWVLKTVKPAAFIENKGQFNLADLPKEKKIIYGTDAGAQIYFHSTGLIYYLNRAVEKPVSGWKKFISSIFKNDSPDEETEKEIKESKSEKRDLLIMEWLDANADAELIAEDKILSYWCYSDPLDPQKSIDKIPAYKKLIYKELYPAIDLVYTFHEKGGIKYSFILHPGADPHKIRMKIAGTKKVITDKQGNIHFCTSSGDIIDHAPQSFYDSGEMIPSAFQLNDNIITFNIAAYDNSRTVILDPWTTTGLVSSFTPMEIGRDGSDNVYVYGVCLSGSYAQQFVQKYDPAGSLQWTYNLSSQPHWNYEYTGDLAVDPSGNSFVSNGFNTDSTYLDYTFVVRINTAGSLIWASPGTSPFLHENWRVTMNNDFSKCYLTGCGPSCCNMGRGSEISVITGVESNLFVPDSIGDIVSSCIGPNGYLYSVCSANLYNSSTDILCLDPDAGFAKIFKIPSNFSTYDSPPPISNYGAYAFNGIAAGCNFLYTFSGDTLYRRSLSTGLPVSSVMVPGGIFRASSGLMVDPCGNIYAGSSTGVYVFNPGMTITGFHATPYPVTDIVPGNGFLYACGGRLGDSTGFVAQFPLSCSPANITSTDASCINNNGGSASVLASFESPPYTYSWNTVPVQTTSSVSGLSPGLYTVIVSGSGACNRKDTLSVMINGGISITTVQNAASCFGSSDGEASVTGVTGTGPYVYSWNTLPVQNLATATGLQAGNYVVTVTDSTGCIGAEEVTVTQPEGISAFVRSTDASCAGSDDGSATIFISDTTGLYSFEWNTQPVQTSESATGLSAGTWSVTVTDANGCEQIFPVIINSSSPNFSAGQEDKTVNIFSPNDDGKNDRFFPFPESQIHFRSDNYKFEVYNRWGQKLFESTDTTAVWEGTTGNGNVVPDGIYFWIISYESPCIPDNIETAHGFVHLLR
jgi:gliding motility-associated-like protein